MGPFDEISLAGGGTAPLYLLRYNADGRLLSPKAEAHLRTAAAGATDVFLFSHGWNNVFGTALGRYREFIAGYATMRADLVLPLPQPYRPVLVGVVWPSTSFVLPWEDGPVIAAAPDPRETEELLRFVMDSLDGDAMAELAELADTRNGLTEDQARRAAEIVHAALVPSDEPDGAAAPPSPDDLLEVWSRLDGTAEQPQDPDAFGTVGTTPAASPQAAGLRLFDPRNVLRAATVWKMKQRSGKVGAHGVAPLVGHVLGETGARLHMAGHSFGARLVLSAIAKAPATDRQVRSLLLLQAAVNRWCFATDAAGTGKSGGYRPVLDRVEQPILTTLSSHDKPLRQVFHLAMRGSHVGEPQIAAIGDEERYGALGGYGPAGLGAAATTVVAKAPGERYDLTGDVIAIDGSQEITGHGVISNPTTWWALHCLTEMH